MAPLGRDIGENSGDVEHCIVRVHLQHEVKLAAVPAFERFRPPQPIKDFRRNSADDATSLPPFPWVRRDRSHARAAHLPLASPWIEQHEWGYPFRPAALNASARSMNMRISIAAPSRTVQR